MYFETHTVISDKQGRITLPRMLLKSGVIVRGGSICLVPMEGDYWMACEPERILRIIEAEFPGSVLDPDVRDMRREFMIRVKSLHVDPQGRVSIPFGDGSNDGLEFMVIGTGWEFEIWPMAVWRATFKEAGGKDEQSE
ncbi:hypothetical protein JXA80_09915 [bacterium]|nr:hypothetical protein [candidate division CSSED10-310 bacterium]